MHLNIQMSDKQTRKYTHAQCAPCDIERENNIGRIQREYTSTYAQSSTLHIYYYEKDTPNTSTTICSLKIGVEKERKETRKSR